MLFLIAIMAGCGAACAGYLLGFRAGRANTDTVQRLLDDEHTRTNDLLTRLAARNLSEYHAFSQFDQSSEPVDDTRYISDPTGLISVPMGDD